MILYFRSLFAYHLHTFFLLHIDHQHYCFLFKYALVSKGVNWSFRSVMLYHILYYHIILAWLTHLYNQSPPLQFILFIVFSSFLLFHSSHKYNNTGWCEQFIIIILCCRSNLVLTIQKKIKFLSLSDLSMVNTTIIRVILDCTILLCYLPS